MAFRSVPRPSSPPGAKASTECPYRAREHSRALLRGGPSITHHAQEPSTPHDTPIPVTRNRCAGARSRHTAGHSLSTFIRASERIARPQGRPAAPTRRAANHPVSSSSRARPETHQNLIHTFKRPTARQQVTPQPRRTAPCTQIPDNAGDLGHSAEPHLFSATKPEPVTPPWPPEQNLVAPDQEVRWR